ncbi:MAG: LD-carboxypeptidase [Ignavibacteriaceae bacterium]|nr:LD-carboxypeptidase [Ignavibacteriaceae bacterium]
MKIIKPKKLSKGDVIGIISPASSADDFTKVESGVRYLEKLGYKVEVGKNVGKYHGYLAGDDNERVEDLHYMFRKKYVNAVICVRGGYGTPRLLDKIDYKVIKANPKILVGYSDITALQMAIMCKTGLVTFAGPMLAVDLAEEVSSFTEEVFWAMITSNKKFGRINQPDDEKIFKLVKGSSKGRIIGGNLTMISALMGTKNLPEFKEKILFIEEIGEVPYRVDRMLNQLRLAKVFNQVKGVILGTFTDCNETDPAKKTLSLGEVAADYFGKLKIPVIYNLRCGHVKDSITIPMGVMVKLNATANVLEIMESAVS